MTRQVALAEATYERLKESKHSGESFSQTIERLLDVAPKDPWIFLQIPKSKVDPDERIRQIEADRDAQWEPA